jgi:hypothetical protein
MQQPNTSSALPHEGQRADMQAATERTGAVGDEPDSEPKVDARVHQEVSVQDALAAQKPKNGATPDERPSTKSANRDLLWEAMEARRSGDLEKMNELAKEYRSEQPTGALDEEALALSLEAAVAKDSPRAQPLAREYLDKYPQGRFSTLAKKVLKKPLP